MFQRLFISILFFALSLLRTQGAIEKLKPLQQLTIFDGLTDNGVTSVVFDSKGYLWIGTYEGLSRYDGYEFKVFKNTIDKNLLVSNRILCVTEDPKGNLWIGTEGGISIYDYATEKFKSLYSNQDLNGVNIGPQVRKVLAHAHSKYILCLTDEDGIYAFNPNYSFYRQFTIPSTKGDEPVRMNDGLKLDDANYLLATSDGLLHFNLENEEIENVVESVKASSSVLRVDAENVLVALPTGVAWVGVDKVGEHYAFTRKTRFLSQYNVRGIQIDALNNLWLSTQNQGLIRINNLDSLRENKAYKIAGFNQKTGKIRISNMLVTPNNGCWVGTFDNGLYHFDVKHNPFRSYSLEDKLDHGITSNKITHFAPYDRQRVLVCGLEDGLSIYNIYSRKFETLPKLFPSKYAQNATDAFVDAKKHIWLRLKDENKMVRVNRNNKTVEEVSDQRYPSFGSARVYAYTEDQHGNVWLACFGDLYKVNIKPNGKIENLESLKDNPAVANIVFTKLRSVYYDAQSDLVWLGTTSNGLFRIDMKEGAQLKSAKVDQFVNMKSNPRSIPSNFTSAIVRTPNKELWIGTEGGGICKVNHSSANPEFIPLTEKSGLTNNVVKSMLCDENGVLWITTNIGLNAYDTKRKQFRSFNRADGLPFGSFWYASTFLPRGFAIFSSIDGFTYFKPHALRQREPLPKLEFDNIKIFNTAIAPGDTLNGRVLMKKRLSDVDELTLRHNENSLTIELKSLHYSTPENHKLKYRLMPISEEWIEVPSNQRFISYSALRPGNYTLSAMASNSQGKFTKAKQLKIVITPPFWKTKMAFVLYILGAVLLVSIVMYTILKVQALNHNLEIEKLEKDKVKEVNAAKLRFFSNISHEIKTPLTLISGPLDILADRFRGNADVKDKLELVQRQSKRILHLVDQVHDFQRSDAKQLKLYPTTFSFDKFVQRLVDDFDFMARNDNKQILAKGDEQLIFVTADNDKLGKILNNLVNNAFKYTDEKDCITIDYKIEGTVLQFAVNDTGKGIDPIDLPHIFERFFQSKKKENVYSGGSGIGLAFSKRLVEMHKGRIWAESELGVGTSIKVEMPIVETNEVEIQKARETEIISEEKNYDADKLIADADNVSKIKVSREFAGAKVFFAEDNSDMRIFISRILSRFFNVTSFTNGKACLNAMQDEWPDLIVSDVLMPEMNGIALCKHVKSDVKTSHIPVVLLTACTALDDQIQGLLDGADAYIKKPFHTQHLVARIESLMQGRKKLRERFNLDIPLTLEKDDGNSEDHAFLESLYALMNENLANNNIDFTHFARQLFMNRTNFYNKVKALTGSTPFELIKMYRLKKASEFLVEQKMSVNEVSVVTGFKSRSHFSKSFKDTYGVTPSIYAQEKAKKQT